MLVYGLLFFLVFIIMTTPMWRQCVYDEKDGDKDDGECGDDKC